MNDEFERDIERLRYDRPTRAALHGPISRVGRLVTAVFVFASVCHLWLADTWHIEWLPAVGLYVAGLILLCWRGAAVGWLACALAQLIPLIFLRDQLTQSVILMAIAATAAVGLAIDGWRSAPGPDNGPSAGSAGPGEWTFLSVARGITISVYALAVVHKLNSDFFDADYSCAIYGTEKLFNYWNLPVGAVPAGLLEATPWMVLAAEGGIALLLLLGRRRLAWPLAVAFHIPLTLTMAPAFAFVMFVGHAAFMRPADLDRLRDVTRRWWPALAAAAAALTAASLVAHKNLPEWTMIPREWLLWTLLLALLIAFPPWRALTFPKRAAHSPNTKASRWARLAAGAVVAVFLLNGLTPYLGVQFQHTGAMVSNLRIDRGCWNSLLFPESMRHTDDYIRVDQVYYGEPGRVPKYEEIVLEQLWSPPQIRQMRRNWCRPKIRPFFMRGTFRGRKFVIEDVCADQALPFDDDGFFGVEVFKNFLRFQKNLPRECPAACIH